MSDQNQQPNLPTLPAAANPIAPNDVNNQQAKPKVTMSDKEVQALLAINNLQAKQRPDTKGPNKIIIVALVLILFAILVSYLVGSFKPGNGSQSTSSGGKLGFPQQSSPTTENSATNQVNQDVKSCTNPVNAVTVC